MIRRVKVGLWPKPDDLERIRRSLLTRANGLGRLIFEDGKHPLTCKTPSVVYFQTFIPCWQTALFISASLSGVNLHGLTSTPPHRFIRREIRRAREEVVVNIVSKWKPNSAGNPCEFRTPGNHLVNLSQDDTCVSSVLRTAVGKTPTYLCGKSENYSPLPRGEGRSRGRPNLLNHSIFCEDVE